MRPSAATRGLAYTILVDEQKSPMPRPTKIVASVAIKAGSLNPTMSAALMLPKRPPTRSAAKKPTPTGAWGSASPTVSAARYMADPTDRSTPALNSTTFMPSATMMR